MNQLETEMTLYWLALAARREEENRFADARLCRSVAAIASQWCTAHKAEVAETNPEILPQRTNQRIAIENNYARVAAIYDGRLADAFRAKLVKPPDVPDHAPALADKTGPLCAAAP